MASASFEMASPYESAARSWWTRAAPGALNRVRRSPLAAGLRLRQQRLQRLLAPRVQLQPALQLEHAVVQVLDVQVQAGQLLRQVVDEVDVVTG